MGNKMSIAMVMGLIIGKDTGVGMGVVTCIIMGMCRGMDKYDYGNM